MSEKAELRKSEWRFDKQKTDGESIGFWKTPFTYYAHKQTIKYTTYAVALWYWTISYRTKEKV